MVNQLWNCPQVGIGAISTELAFASSTPWWIWTCNVVQRSVQGHSVHVMNSRSIRDATLNDIESWIWLCKNLILERGYYLPPLDLNNWAYQCFLVSSFNLEPLGLTVMVERRAGEVWHHVIVCAFDHLVFDMIVECSLRFLVVLWRRHKTSFSTRHHLETMTSHPEVLWAQRSSETDAEKVYASFMIWSLK